MVVSATVYIPYMDVLLMVHCMQALPDDADLTAIKDVCQAILEEEHRFLSVSTSSLVLACSAYHRPPTPPPTCLRFDALTLLLRSFLTN